MDNFYDMDALESFVLEFLAYRREMRERHTSQPPWPQIVDAHIGSSVSGPTFQEVKPPVNLPLYHEQAQCHTRLTLPSLDSIGKGWPHYKDANTGNRGASTAPEYSDIIPTLTPLVAQAINRFGQPTNAATMNHLVNQVIASAMAIPQISESIHTAESTPWGRLPLLQAVVELMINQCQ